MSLAGSASQSEDDAIMNLTLKISSLTEVCDDIQSVVSLLKSKTDKSPMEVGKLIACVESAEVHCRNVSKQYEDMSKVYEKFHSSADEVKTSSRQISSRLETTKQVCVRLSENQAQVTSLMQKLAQSQRSLEELLKDKRDVGIPEMKEVYAQLTTTCRHLESTCQQMSSRQQDVNKSSQVLFDQMSDFKNLCHEFKSKAAKESASSNVDFLHFLSCDKQALYRYGKIAISVISKYFRNSISSSFVKRHPFEVSFFTTALVLFLFFLYSNCC